MCVCMCVCLLYYNIMQLRRLFVHLTLNPTAGSKSRSDNVKMGCSGSTPTKTPIKGAQYIVEVPAEEDLESSKGGLNLKRFLAERQF